MGEQIQNWVTNDCSALTAGYSVTCGRDSGLLHILGVHHQSISEFNQCLQLYRKYFFYINNAQDKNYIIGTYLFSNVILCIEHKTEIIVYIWYISSFSHYHP